MRHAVLTFCTLAVLGGGPAWAEGTRQAIEAANQRFVAAFNQGDAATVAGLYATDAAVLPPGQARVDGRSGIQQFWKGAIDAGSKDLGLETVEVVEDGDNAAEVGRWRLSVPTGKGDAQTVAGKYVVLWRRAGGDWQLYRDIWNADPAPQK
jgi:uncharacterized protein (TIGR02246 family)